MAVYDRWHKSHPRAGDKPCTCGTKRNPMYPTAAHKQGLRFQVRWYDDNGEQQKRNRPERGGKRGQSDPDIYAEALDAKIRNELNTGTYVDPALGLVVLKSFAQGWRKDLTGDPASLERCDDRLAHIIGKPADEAPPIIATKTLRDLEHNPALIQSWIKSLEVKGLGPQTISLSLGVLTTIFKAAIAGGAMNKNPINTPAVKPPTVTRERIVPWTMPQIHAAADELGGRDAGIPKVGAGAGMRAGEIFAFGMDEIDWTSQMIKVLRQIRIVENTLVFSLPKGGKQRDVPMGDWLTLTLLEQIEQYPAVAVTLPWRVPDGKPRTYELLFVRPSGKPRHGKEFARPWQRARRAAGAPDTRENGVHVGRHTFASACLANGVDIRTLADWLGHSNVTTTLKYYAHLMPTAAERGRAAIDTFFTEPDDSPEQSAPNVPSERQQ